MIRWAAGRPAVVWSAGVALILAGGVAFTKLPLATKTQVELPRLSVTAEWFGASPELMETYVTSPMEEVIQGVRGVKKVSSESGDGDADVTIELDTGTDVTMARLEINERLELLRDKWPIGMSPPRVANYTPEELRQQPLLTYSVIGPYTPGTLTRLSREQVEPRISAVEGVSGVGLYGSAEPSVAVTYEPARLRQLGVDPDLLRSAIRDARVVEALGEERRGANVLTVAVRDQPKVLADLEQLVIRAPSGRLFRLHELASVRPDEDNRGRFRRIDGVPAVSLQVTRLAGADAIKTADRIKATMAEVERILPPGIRFKLEQDESKELKEQLNELMIRGGIAFLAVMLVLALWLRNLPSIWLVMGSAAVSIAGTALGLYLLDIPANLLTLAGLGMGIGILVQNGLVVVERLRHAPDTPDGRAETGRRIAPAVVGSTLTTAVVLFPFLYLQGNARAAFMPFAAAFLFALAWSVVSSVVMIPAVGAGHGMARAGWKRLHRWYGKSVLALVRWRWVTLVAVTALLGLVTWKFFTKVPRASWGNWGGQRSEVFVSISFPRGSDPKSVDGAMREFERLAVGGAGVDRVESFSMGGGRGLMRVTFTKDESIGALPALMQEELTQRAVFIGGASIGVQGRGPGFYSGGGGGASVSFRIKILGYSFSGVEALARDLKGRLERIPRVRDVNINAGSFWGNERAVSVTLEPIRPALARAGMTASDFARAVQREVRGPTGGQRLELEGDEVTVSVKAKGAQDRDLDDLRNALVPNTSDAPVRVGDLAAVAEREGLSQITREDQQYVRIVSYDFRGPQKLATRTHDAFMDAITVPAGYTVDDDRFAFFDDDSTKGLWLVFAIGVALVILSVAVVFDSAWAAAMVFLSLPLALAGVAGIFWATGTAFSREAAVGVILVVGLAVNQTILLVDAALAYRRARPTHRLTAADVIHAARDRAGMIVLVTLTTIASLIPLAIGTEVDSLFGSIALATSGGTVAGTVAALWIVPVFLVGWRTTRTRPAAA
ncbi:MAG: efflux RND transporter permease subunit [Gemmatimonadetes bacterium]|nr:efflux RND transporter permease subunit [Gemmatimonadota bacterium]